MIAAALDRFIGVFSPMRAIQRAQARALLSAYKAGERNRMNNDWQTSARSADASIIPESPLMIQRCRDATRNDPNMSSIKKAFVRNVVGKGFTHQSAAADLQGKPLTDFNKQSGDQFWKWSNKATNCDAERRHSLHSFTRWAMSEMVEAGGCILIMSWSANLELILQAVEYEQLDRTKLEHNGNEIRGGVEVSTFGAAVAYHIHHRHPNDYAGTAYPARFSLDSERIPADRIIHVFDPERARQSLGAPILAPVIMKARDLSQYDYAQLLAARAEACIGVIIESTAPGGTLGLANPAGADATDTDGNGYFDMKPMMAARLNPGEVVKGFSPTRPGNMYEPFIRSHKGEIAAGTGLSYDQIARDPDSSFSAARQSLLEDRREFAAKQQLLIDCMLQPIYEEWLRLEILSNRINATGLGASIDTIAYAEWLPHGHEWIDPEKEAKAEALAVETGQTTRQESLAKRGRDYYEVKRQSIAEEVFERDARAAAGLAPALPAPNTPAPAGAPA
jgi:lambda family phage portal protein